MINKIIKYLLILIIIYLIGVWGTSTLNNYFGWLGREQWIYRRSTFGDKQESINRKVFVKDLKFNTNIEVKKNNIFIEKGFTFTRKGIEYTDFIKKTNFPYQISFTKVDSTKDGNIIYNIINKTSFDSISNELLNTQVFLKEPILRDTLILKVVKFNKKRDSIGYIKIWDPCSTKYDVLRECL